MSNINITQIPAQSTLEFLSSSPQCNLILPLSSRLPIHQRNHLNLFFSSCLSIESGSVLPNLSVVEEFLGNVFTNFIFEKLLSHQTLVMGRVTATSNNQTQLFTGSDPASNFRRGDFTNIWQSSLITGSIL